MRWGRTILVCSFVEHTVAKQLLHEADPYVMRDTKDRGLPTKGRSDRNFGRRKRSTQGVTV